jgi:hypothetical protein
MRREFQIEKLRDECGQYTPVLKAVRAVRAGMNERLLGFATRKWQRRRGCLDPRSREG